MLHIFPVIAGNTGSASNRGAMWIRGSDKKPGEARANPGSDSLQHFSPFAPKPRVDLGNPGLIYTFADVGMEVMGKSVSRSRRQGQEDAGKNVNKQEKGVV